MWKYFSKGIPNAHRALATLPGITKDLAREVIENKNLDFSEPVPHLEISDFKRSNCCRASDCI